MLTHLRRRALNAAWWSAVELAARYGVQFLVTLLLARLLTPTDFGLLAMMMAFIVFAGVIVDGGFGYALIQRQSDDADDATTAFVSTLAAALALGALLWLAAPAVAAFYRQPALLAPLRLLCLILPLNALAAIPNALLSLRLDFRPRALTEVVASLVSGAAALVLALHGHGVWSLVWQALIAAALRALLLWRASRWWPRGRFRPANFAALFRFSGFLLLANLLNTTAVRLQSLMLGKLFDPRTLGFYSLAQDTQQAPSQLLTSLLNRIGLPVFSKVAGNPDSLRAALRLSLRLSLFLYLPCMAGIAVSARPLIELLYGPRWLPAAPLLSVLALSALFWPIHVLNLAALGASGRADLIFRLETIKAALSIPLVLAASWFGPLAVAWAVVASSFACIFINTWHNHEFLGYGAFAQILDQRPTFLLTFISTVCAGAVLQMIASPAPAVIAAIITSAVVYLALAWRINPAVWQDMLRLLSHLRQTETTT